MRKVLLTGLFFFSAGHFSAGQVHAQDLQYAREVIAELGSERLGGRGYARRGDARAASYIRREFISNGLMPLTPDYFQPFHVDVNTFPSKVELSVNGTRLVPGTDFMVEPSSPKIKGKYDVKVIDAKEFLYNDSLLSYLDGENLFILIDNRQSAELDATEKDALSRKIEVMQSSPLTHVAGLLELIKDNTAWGITGHVSSIPLFRISRPMDPDTLVSITVHIASRFRQGYLTRNIAGYFKGTEYPDSFLVFTAHYDHIGMMGRQALFPGAHDNASGVAMLLYLSRYFQLHPPRVSVVFLSFSAEELGLVGSSYFVRHSPIDLSSIRFLVNFDMVGTGTSGIKVVNGTLYTDEFAMLKGINEQEHLLPSISARSPSCISDHCPFDYQHVPAFYIYTEGTSPEYHSVNDRLDELSLEGFEDLANLMVRFTSSL